MSATTMIAEPAAAAAPRIATERRFHLDFRLMSLALVVMTMIYVAYRVYQQFAGWKYGLDATTPEFSTYWLTLFKVELPVLYGAVAVNAAYLFATRDRQVERVTPEVEMRRYFTFVMWLLVYTFCFYWTGSFFAEGDGDWHQTVLRDTPLTPSHIVLFYASIPLYLFFGVGAFVYAMTRLPAFARNISLMLVFAVVGPFLILPNLGYNEWGHAYWLTEEIFSHPLHWGFVLLGWNALALAGVLLQVITRFRALFPVVFREGALGA